MNANSQIVLAALRVHSSRSVSQAELMTTVGCTGRAVRIAISELRREGWLIVGNKSGYRFARNIEEVHQVILELERQVHSLQQVRQALVKAAESRFGLSL